MDLSSRRAFQPGTLLLLLGMVATGCRDGTPTDADAPEFSLRPASGDQQQGMSGVALVEPLRVQVTLRGKPMPGIPVEWQTRYGSIAGGGQTDAEGIARAVWTLPAKLYGTRRATASLSGRPGSTVSFTVDASHPELEVVGGNGQEGPAGQPLDAMLQLRVTWRGNPVGGVPIGWDSADVVTSSGRTDAAGLVAATWTLGTVAGHQRTGARLATHGADGPRAEFHAAALPGPPTAIRWFDLPFWNGTAPVYPRGTAGHLTVSGIVTDALGNRVPGVGVSWTIVTPQGQVISTGVRQTDTIGYSRGELSMDAHTTGHDFAVIGSLPGVPPDTTWFTVVDFLASEGGMGDYWLNSTATVRAGEEVRWASVGGRDHQISLATMNADGTISMVTPIGRLDAHPGKILRHVLHAPGTYLVVCADHLYAENPMEIIVVP
jgi:hypothetical protein